MAPRYFYLQETVQHGPVSEAELRRLACAGTVGPETLVWREGAPDWAPASRIAGLFPSSGDSAEAPPPLPGSGAIPNRGPAAEWVRSLTSETRAIARVTAAQLHRLSRLGRARWQNHRLSRRAVDLQAEFGQRLRESGLGASELHNRLKELDEQIAGMEWTRASSREAEAERRGLLVRLAAPFLDGAAPAGMEAEHAQACEAIRAERAAHQRALQERAGLLPEDATQRRRLAIGVAALLGGLLVALWAVLAGREDHEHPSRLLGTWEGQTAWIITFTTRFEFQEDGRVSWHQDFGDVAPDKSGSGAWRVEHVEGDRYALEIKYDDDPDPTRPWNIVFQGEDEFTVTGFDDIPITVQRRQ